MLLWYPGRNEMSIFSLFSQTLLKESYVFFDVETTGLYPLAGDRILEIALIKTVKGTITDTFEIMFNPGKPIPEEATMTNNITDEMVSDCPPFSIEIVQKIQDFIGDSILVAHNAAFDLGFLSVEMGRLGVTFDGWRAIDTLKIAQSIFTGQRNRLENLIRRYNIQFDGTLHRALADTDALRKVYFEMIDETDIRGRPVEQVIKKYGFNGQYVYHSFPAHIREGLVEKQVMKAQYKTREGSVIEIAFRPLAAVWVDKNWFLLARDSDEKSFLALFGPHFIGDQ
jgi:DNA polymerase-3 subunit epsilon